MSGKPFFFLLSAVLIFSGTLLYRDFFDRSEVPGTLPTVSSPDNPVRGPETPEPLVNCQNLYKTVCQKTGVSRDPTGTVRPDVEGELEALRIYQGIIRQHPDWRSEEVDEELVKTIYTLKRMNRIKSAFNWVKKDIESFIDKQDDYIFNSQEKNQLKNRLKKLKLQLPPPASVYSDEPDLFTKNDVYYERMSGGELRMRVGGAYLYVAKSWFNLIFTLAHESAHSIDPCEIRSARLSFPSYDRLTACFLRDGLIAIPKSRSECGENDQLSETFADWVAVHVTGDALRTFATEFHGQQLVNAARNSVRDLCAQEDPDEDLDIEFHPPPEVRIEKIFGRNPTIRELMGCGPPVNGPEYCSFETKMTAGQTGKGRSSL